MWETLLLQDVVVGHLDTNRHLINNFAKGTLDRFLDDTWRQYLSAEKVVTLNSIRWKR